MKNKSQIKLATHDACTGCAACAAVCPTCSISMREDREGFLQPHIDADTCIDCHKCEKTCPIISPLTIPTDFETQAYVAINKDEAIRMRSSSGGMFHALAKRTIEQGGVVFGARFNDQWEVVHDYTETIEGLEPFMRSKYVQSRIGDTFNQAKQFLEQGRQVLFVGTPCQIGGLKAFLHKDYENLLTVDFVCHGVPSPKVWREYLKDSLKGDTLVDFNFRDKQDGWLNYQCVTTTSTSTRREQQMTNLYFRGFLKDVYLRRSCYACQFKTINRVSEITLADAWGVQDFCPEMHDDKGTSLVFIHTKQGIDMLRTIELEIRMMKQNISDAVSINVSMIQSMEMPARRADFFRAMRIINSFHYASRYVDKDRLDKRLIRKVAKVLHIRK